jgi:hypothetical protein
MPLFSATRLAIALPWLLAVFFGQTALAQSFCASTGQPQPQALLERFINADCADCWADPATPRVQPGQVALDWMLPGSLGEDAPLSAVANRDASARLQALGQALPAKRWATTSPVSGSTPGQLRVAHGLAVSGYVGASIEIKGVSPDAPAQPWTAWLALVESVPAGTEGSPVARNLVRNVFRSEWDVRRQPSAKNLHTFFDSRAMNIPPGMNTGRMRVTGWIENAQGKILLAAQSRCLKN